MDINFMKMHPWGTPLAGVAGEKIMPKEVISLPAIVTHDYHHIVHLIDFFIVYRKNAYSYVINHPYTTSTKCAISIRYLAIKVPTITSIITI